MRFPSVIFRLCHVYDDYFSMTLYDIKDDKVISEHSIDHGKIKVCNCTISSAFHFKTTTIKGNITDFFVNNYPYEFDYNI